MNEVLEVGPDIAAAWKVHKKMQEQLFSVRQRYYRELQHAVARRGGMDCLPAWPDVFGLLEPVDICRAALAAVEQRPERSKAE